MPEDKKNKFDDHHPGTDPKSLAELLQGVRVPGLIWVGIMIVLSLFGLGKTWYFNAVLLIGGAIIVSQLMYVLPFLKRDEKVAARPRKGKAGPEEIPASFRGVPWGADKIETRTRTEEELGRSVDGDLTGIAELAGLEFDTRYVFEDDKLREGRYSTEAVFDPAGGDLMFAYLKVLRTLEKKYGKGKGGAKWTDAALKGSEVEPEKFGPYVSRGELRLKNWWDGEETKIAVEMEGGHGMQSLVIRYEEKREG